MEVAQIVSIVVCIISALIGPICIILFRREIDKKDRRRQDEENHLNAVRKQEIKSVVEEVVAPVRKDIEDIKSQANDSRHATIANLRATMKRSRDIYVQQGFADIGDKATWKELYNDYAALGGNNFKDYVDAWYEAVKNLPEEKSVKTRKSTTKK